MRTTLIAAAAVYGSLPYSSTPFLVLAGGAALALSFPLEQLVDRLRNR